jgi:hypothetical protein
MRCGCSSLPSGFVITNCFYLIMLQTMSHEKVLETSQCYGATIKIYPLAL